MFCLQKWRNYFCGISMPYFIRKRKSKNCYSVKTKKRMHSKCTTLKKAKAQVRLLQSLEH
jgi:hypothetical protein